MDYETVRAGIAGIPFNSHVGLTPGEVVGQQAVVCLPAAPHLLNHVGSQHGSAVFAAAEAASGAALYAAFLDHMEGLVPLAERGEIRFTKRAEGPLEAQATLNGQPTRILAEVEAQGRTRLTVDVDVTNQAGDSVADATFHWYLRRAG